MTETMLRNANDPTATQPRTSEERVVERACECGAPVTLTIPAGTLVAIAEMTARFAPRCDACQAAEDAQASLAEGRRLRRQRLEAAGLPRMLRELRWADYDLSAKGAKQAVASARRWASGQRHGKPGLLVCGRVGVGKTRLAATAAWELLLHRDVRWVSVPDLIVRLGAAFNDADRAKAMKVLTGKGALVLDDLDKIKPSAWVLSNLFTAIDSRYQSGAPLLVTTNLKPDQLVAYFTGTGQDQAERRQAAEAIMSRLIEMCVMHQIDGPDRRRA